MSEHRSGRVSRWFTAAALAVGAAGCGESRPEVGVATFPVQGKVVLSGGEPLTSGVVVFVSDSGGARPISGTVNPDGTYSIMTDGVAAGAPAGEYKVRVEIDPDAPATGKTSKKSGGLTFPAKYSKETTSGLTATVKPEAANDLPAFELK